jgi:hypothetical protein
MDMASIDKMRARSHLFSHAVELATEHEGVLQIPCQEQLRSKPLLGENCITTVLADGSRYFVKMLTEDEAVGARSAAAAEQKAKVGLLSQSMRELSKEAERLRIESLTKSKKNSIVSTSDMHSNQVCRITYRVDAVHLEINSYLSAEAPVGRKICPQIIFSGDAVHSALIISYQIV